jgi:hypothetical protein
MARCGAPYGGGAGGDGTAGAAAVGRPRRTGPERGGGGERRHTTVSRRRYRERAGPRPATLGESTVMRTNTCLAAGAQAEGRLCTFTLPRNLRERGGVCDASRTDMFRANRPSPRSNEPNPAGSPAVALGAIRASLAKVPDGHRAGVRCGGISPAVSADLVDSIPQSRAAPLAPAPVGRAAPGGEPRASQRAVREAMARASAEAGPRGLPPAAGGGPLRPRDRRSGNDHPGHEAHPHPVGPCLRLLPGRGAGRSARSLRARGSGPGPRRRGPGVT